MISVSEAYNIIAGEVEPLGVHEVGLAKARGRRLAVDIVSDSDSPPFDKSVVDGYAVSTGDISSQLREIELVTAGSLPANRISPGTTIRVMTGAAVPEGADAVVKWENCTAAGENVIKNPAPGVASGACILRRGTAFRAGDALLPARQVLRPVDIALLAEIGRAHVECFGKPRVAVLATGDELVDPSEPTKRGQIRNSNGPMLVACLESMGADVVDLGIARDDADELSQRLAKGLECNILLASGGVSAGVKDLVPSILERLGVVERFHKVNMKPGKPLWFGVKGVAGGRSLVFGLPGNPVSTLVSFKLFVEPALGALAGGALNPPTTHKGALMAPASHRGGRPTYHPSRRRLADGGMQIELLAWQGSADLATLARSDSLTVLPGGDYELPQGAVVDYIEL